MPIKASAQEPQATGGRVLAEQALAGRGRVQSSGEEPRSTVLSSGLTLSVSEGIFLKGRGDGEMGGGTSLGMINLQPSIGAQNGISVPSSSLFPLVSGTLWNQMSWIQE